MFFRRGNLTLFKFIIQATLTFFFGLEFKKEQGRGYCVVDPLLTNLFSENSMSVKAELCVDTFCCENCLLLCIYMAQMNEIKICAWAISLVMKINIIIIIILYTFATFRVKP